MALRPPHHVLALKGHGFANDPRLLAWTGYSRDPAVPTPLRPPFADNATMAVQEY
jgi:hypothetical protein